MRSVYSYRVGFFLMLLIALNPLYSQEHNNIFLRLNQVGYLQNDSKVAIAFSDSKLNGKFEIFDAQKGKRIFRGTLQKIENKSWGNFRNYYRLDFSDLKKEGRYYLKVRDSRSPDFGVGSSFSYKNYQENLLGFMRQQRCGYNPFLDMVCHQRDGRTMYGPMPDSTFIDLSGGWHDAGDQLKYLITSSNATGKMLKAFELFPEKFTDEVDALGHLGANGIPDVLDEAKWGLDWIHKMHSGKNELFHQVGDDRDHIGMKFPDQDSANYGWGPNSYRVAYFANGKPQGLREFKSKANGIANLAGRSAAAMAIAARIWKNILKDNVYSEKCRIASEELYAMGKAYEGYQQGNSYGAPYRYNEDTWTDDMEWAAAELYKNTEQQEYLLDAKHYAEMANTISWMGKEQAAHYRYYPFFNIGHFVLYSFVEKDFKEKLAGYYRYGIEKCMAVGTKNPFHVGVPFIWCSNNLVVNLISQIQLYEQMTGDTQYRSFMEAQRDWLFGRNPWGTSMFTNIPENGEYPESVHTSIWYLTRKEVSGGLVDGPVYASVYKGLKGITLKEKDEFAQFQNDFIVYHDDFGDYSTNEPTMDGTADAVLMMAFFAANKKD